MSGSGGNKEEWKLVADQQTAVELLQQFGLKEYEAKCFVALTPLSSGTAKEISQRCSVPRTRVYEAARVLESKGLVEVQHTSPKRFRAVPVGEAATVLREEYEERTEQLADTLEQIESEDQADDEEIPCEVWSLSGATTITNRTAELVASTTREVVLVVGDENVATETLVNRLRTAGENGINVVVATVSDDLGERIRRVLPRADVFTLPLGWLHGSPLEPDGSVQISRLLLVDRSTVLVGSVARSDSGEETETAVVGQGKNNGLVVIARRMLAIGLLPRSGPKTKA